MRKKMRTVDVLKTIWRNVKRKKILIIDDEENFIYLTKKNLERKGRYEVRTENEGSNGLVAAKEFMPDLILLDIVMPDMEGSDVATQIRKDEKVKDIPIVFLTATITKEEVESGGGVIGGHPFLAKPVGIEELIACIEKNMGK